MAVTKTIKVGSHLRRAVDYAANEKKTGLDAAVSYITCPGKTERGLFESVINCGSVSTAYAEMRATKRRWGKTGGVAGYHIIQSFAPGEVSPRQAHSIGVEFAQKCFGGRYEAVIGTHLDRRHLHNHIVINSVSFVDGYKYRNNFEDYFVKIRGASDKLCLENSLSVIDPQGRGKSYAEWKSEKEDKPTIRNVIRAEIDEVIGRSFTFKSFIAEMEKSGYEVKHGGNVKHIAVKPPFGDKYIRLKSLGNGYAEGAIKARLQEKQVTGGYGKALPTAWPIRRNPKAFSGRTFKGRKLHGFRALYFHYLYLLGGVKKRKAPARVSAYMRGELIKFSKYKEQFEFITKQKIETADDLSACKARLINQIDAASNHRKTLYQKRRDAKSEQENDSVSNEIRMENQTIKTLRRQLRICEGIEESTALIKERLQQAKNITTLKEGTSHEPRGRRSRPNDKPFG